MAEPDSTAVRVALWRAMHVDIDAPPHVISDEFAMTFQMPIELADPAARPGLEMSVKGARASGTPFISFYEPDEVIRAALEAGFKEAQHVSSLYLTIRQCYIVSDHRFDCARMLSDIRLRGMSTLTTRTVTRC